MDKSLSPMNILIIPSWFGDSKSPNAGSFFKDEATLVAMNHNVVMMVFDKVIVPGTCDAKDRGITGSMEAESVNNRLTVLRVKLPFYEDSSWDYNLRHFHSLVLHAFDNAYTGFKVDIIHAYATFWGGIFAHWISAAYNIPYIITEHFGPFNMDFLHSSYVRIEMKTAIEESTSFACVSSHLRQQILMQGILCNPIVIGNYVNDGLFQISRKVGDDILLLTVAYYPSYIKDLETLLEAYSILVRHNFKFKAVIVGGGEIKGGFKGSNVIADMVKKFDLTQHVQVIGAVLHSEIVEIMQKCSCYVCSSIAESFGVSICEAMLCGKPCVITSNGGSMDFVNANNAIIVDIHNPSELADGITQMIETKNRFNPDVIRQGIVEKYGTKSFIRKLNELYIQTVDAYVQR